MLVGVQDIVTKNCGHQCTIHDVFGVVKADHLEEAKKFFNEVLWDRVVVAESIVCSEVFITVLLPAKSLKR